MSDYKSQWAPLPLRFVFGLNFLVVGLPKLLSAAGHANAVHLLQGLGMPAPEIVAWVIALIELAGGFALLIGLFVPGVATLLALNVGLLALMQDGLQAPLPGQPGLPDSGVTLILLTGLVALIIGGSGGYSVDEARARRALHRMRPLTLIAKIKPGQEEPLRKVLKAINADIAGNPHIHFSEDLKTHFARWFIFNTPEVGPRLAFASTYNGDLESYVAELVRVSPGLDEIWGKCEGYTGRANFLAFVRQHAVPSPYWFTAYPYETVESIRNKIAIRQELEKFLDRPDVAGSLDRPGLNPFLQRLAGVADPSVLVAFERWLTTLIADVVAFVRKIFVGIAIPMTKVYAQFDEPKEFPRVFDISSDPEARRRYLQHLDDLEANEDKFVQNQLTVVAPIRPDRLLRLRLALFIGGYLAGYGYPPGELTGVFTIHFLHWVIFDDGKYGFVLSNYDGSWENYLGDFADKLNYGLDALFNNCKNYPPGGLSRPEAWAHWIRSAQVECPLYYSAYPQETALHITRDRAISAGLGQNFDRAIFRNGVGQV
jgi:uncharacterized membrane protein YphA (DoxX/SURF4 family)